MTNNYEVIYLTNSGGYFLIKDNLIINNNFGILLSSAFGPYYPDFCSIIYNLIADTLWYGLVVESNYNTIFYNSFINNFLEGKSQAKDDGLKNVWYNETLQEGNYWSDWWGYFSYNIDGSAKSYDPYPSDLPFHATNIPTPQIFIGRVILGLSLGLSLLAFIIISFLMVNKFKKKREQLIL
jgi:hypothetical protein